MDPGNGRSVAVARDLAGARSYYAVKLMHQGIQAMMSRHVWVALISVTFAVLACRTAGVQDGAADSQKGRELFEDMGCSAWHVEAAGKIAPPLAGLFGARVSRIGGETILADEAYIREAILLPQQKVVMGYDPVMPTYDGRIGEEQLAALVEYITSLGEDG